MTKINQESSEQQKRFVILHHHFPDGGNGEFFDHFDLMLEQESKLATWQLETLPEPNKAVSAKKLADHRELYLNYEGPISNGRGSVERIMEGTYRVCQNSNVCLEVLMTSNADSMRLKIVAGSSGTATIFRIGPSAPIKI